MLLRPSNFYSSMYLLIIHIGRIALGSCRLTKSKKENKMFENTVSKDEEQNKEGKL